MLYWLPGLTITPQFGELLEHFDSLFTDGPMPVAISGSQGPDTLSANDLAGHLVTSCISSVPVLRSIQGRSVSDDPLLHYTYRNSEFAYPSSGSALFNALSKYTYALQFQLYFLYRQCSTGITTCGWWLCKFGSDVFPKDDTTVPSSFCGSVEVTKGSHDGNKCGLQPDCPSPLQAFLTDNLKGFRRDPSDPYSHLAECTVGSMCHVPMGFKVNDLRGLATGGHLMIALNSFCGKSNTPLTKMRHTLSCITKRTPRTLSDVFGFTFHLTGQMFHEAIKQNDPTTNIMSALQPLISKIPDTIKHLFFDVTSDLQKMGSRFFDLSLHCHKVTTSSTVNKRNGSYCDHHTSEKAADLASLSGCTNGKNCGKYLEPLAVSSGATFANYFASTYLTWALYLTDDIYESFQEFLDRFNSLKCTGRKNCKHDCSHPSGTSTAACSCPSVVDCSDVLPHLYAYGFSFHNAYWLKGRDYTSNQWNDNDNKRNCASFHDQLHSVISGNPLSNLLTSIDTFLYAIRWEFFSKLSGFWTIYVCIILYTFFFLLDTLHLRSHFKLTSSHTVPPLALLTSGKPLPVTKLTYIAQ
ncbi:uncharacterized protein BcabD6B2_09730 [Babesia caballi]|uniref:Uncharacterized protein n=1 Tax=Babesia caballi TaxID=5871 RepID=A0AAV4LNQ5_BABCB|nr:hypothetical protein, conserved [Babesia caballi]